MVELPGNLDEMVRVALGRLRDDRAAAADQVRRAMEESATPSAGKKPGRPRCRSCATA